MKSRLLILGLALLVVIPLSLALTASVYRPLATVLWTFLLLVSRFFRSIPQAFVWMLFLGLVTAFAIGSLVRLDSAPPEQPEESPDLPGPVWRLAQTIRQSRQGAYTRWRLARYLGELAADAFEHRGLPVPDLKRQEWALDGVDAPPEVLAYLRAGLIGRYWDQEEPSSWAKARLGRDHPSSPLEVDLEAVIRFLEEQTEVRDDR